MFMIKQAASALAYIFIAFFCLFVCLACSWRKFDIHSDNKGSWDIS